MRISYPLLEIQNSNFYPKYNNAVQQVGEMAPGL